MAGRLSRTQPLEYRIDVQGHVDVRLTDWFEGMQINLPEPAGTVQVTSLVGTLADQATLMGLLRKLYDRGYLLLSVECLTYAQSNA